MKRLLLLAAVFFAAWISPAWSQSFFGYATVNANLRAGPDAGYPRVSTVPAGARLQIFGCLDGWYWCDVAWGPDRGWISAGLIASDFGGGRVVVYDNGPRLGLPFVTFSLGLYWDNYYRSRNWYRQRSHWDHYRPPPPRPGRPPGYRPPHHQPPPVHRPPSTRPPGHGRPPSNGKPPSNGRPPPSTGRPPSGKPPPSTGRPPSGKPPPSSGRPPPQTKPPSAQPPPSTRPAPGKPAPRDNGKPPPRDGDKP